MKQSHPRSRAARLMLVTVVAATPVLAPSAGLAGPAQDAPVPQGDDGLVAGADGVELLRANGASADVVGSLDQLSAEVQAQVAAVIDAREAEAAAAAALDQATAAVDETQAELDALLEESDQVVVDAFVNPPIETAFEALSASSPMEATVKQSVLDAEADHSASVLTRLEETQNELATVKDAQEEAAGEAEARAAEAEAALEDLEASQSAETQFVLAVEDRLADRLAEAEALADLDPEAAEALRAREAEIAGALAEIATARERRAAEAAFYRAVAEAAERAEAEEAQRAAAAAAAPALGPATGSLSTVACPGGGSITVDSSLAGNLTSMLSAAAADGLNLCGNGYRDPAEQIALREAHCGSSYYAIYEAPSSSCSPPTAKPGTSQHELGLAIDFTCNGGGALGSSSPCFDWLQANAANYGLYNLPSEPWHWSNDGT